MKFSLKKIRRTTSKKAFDICSILCYYIITERGEQKNKSRKKRKKKKKTLDKPKKMCYNKNVKRKRKLLQIKKLG